GTPPAGRRLPLSLPRRWVADLLHFARKVPSIPVQRRMDLARVVAARHAAACRPGWAAVFAKAYALVAAEAPSLRQAYREWPRPHLYEYSESLASVAIERPYGGEPAVFFAQLRTPDRQDLLALDRHLRRFKTAPVGGVGEFRQLIRVSRLWRPVRRL